MRTTEVIAIIALAISGLTMILFLFNEDRKFKKQLSDLKRLEQRNKLMPEFRMMVLDLFGDEAYKELPEYGDMLYDTKELTMKNYVNINRTINLN